MEESYSTGLVFKSTPEQVSKLLGVDETTPELWRRQDLAAIVRHQMAAPLEFDLATLKLSQSEQQILNDAIADTSPAPIRTFGELFHNPHPPLELLKLSHRFFRQNIASSPKGSPEHKIAYLFYLLSIVLARFHTGVKISRLSDPELLKSIKSMADRPWVDQQIRELLARGRERIAAAPAR